MSMMCPRCEEKMDCVNSRRQPVGTIKRSYRCKLCGARVYSVEVMVKFKEAKHKELSKDELTRRATAQANLAAEILISQGIEI